MRRNVIRERDVVIRIVLGNSMRSVLFVLKKIHIQSEHSKYAFTDSIYTFEAIRKPELKTLSSNSNTILYRY